MGIQADAGIGELAEIDLAQADQPSLAQALDHDGIDRGRRRCAAKSGTAGGDLSLQIEEVLPGQGYAIQRRTRLSSAPALPGSQGFGATACHRQGDEDGRGRLGAPQGRFEYRDRIEGPGGIGFTETDCIHCQGLSGFHRHSLNVHFIIWYV